MIRLGVESVDLSENIYNLDYVPTAEEHYLRQDPGEQGKIVRPRLMISFPPTLLSPWRTFQVSGQAQLRRVQMTMMKVPSMTVTPCILAVPVLHVRWNVRGMMRLSEFSLRDLGRTALAGRAVLREHQLNNSDTYYHETGIFPILPSQ